MLIPDYKHSRSNRENLPLPIQVHLSKKTKKICCNFILCLESTLNFKHFEEKNEPRDFGISESIDSGRSDLLNA